MICPRFGMFPNPHGTTAGFMQDLIYPLLREWLPVLPECFHNKARGRRDGDSCYERKWILQRKYDQLLYGFCFHRGMGLECGG